MTDETRVSLEFRALGPLIVLHDAVPVELGKGHERALVGLLVLHAGQPVSTDHICDALWDERPPPTAREMVRNYVARARKRLGEGSITTLPTGYRLEADAQRVDLLEFERLGQEGTRALEMGDPERALESLDDALALWRGPPFPELDFMAAGRDASGRLEKLRLEIVEDRAEAGLAMGRSGALVPELEQLLRKHPDRERMRRQLMLALYRSGRQRDALDCYQEGRTRLVEDAGLEPGPELQELQLAILRHDSALDAPRLDGSPANDPPGKRRTIPRAALVGVATVALVAAVVVARSLLGDSSSPIVLSSQSLAVLDPSSGATIGSVKLTSSPGPLAVSENEIWIGTHANDAVLAIDPDALQTRRDVPLATPPFSLAAGGDSVWVANSFFGTVTQIDRDMQKSRPIRPQPRSTGRLPLAYGFGSLWVGSQDDTVTRLDPRTGRTLAVIRDVSKPQAIAVSANGVWIAEATRDDVVHVDPGTNHVVGSVPIGGTATSIASTGDAVWVTTPGEGRLWRIDPRTNSVTASIDVGTEPTSVTTSDGAVWVSSPNGTMERIDPKTNLVTKTVALNQRIASIAGDRKHLFVTLP